jgi:hypothetical protein
MLDEMDGTVVMAEKETRYIKVYVIKINKIIVYACIQIILSQIIAKFKMWISHAQKHSWFSSVLEAIQIQKYVIRI